MGTFTVLNDRGIHTRPATELVKCSSNFRSQITLKTREMTVNGKSLLGILTLMATRGTRVKVQAEGADAEEAVDAILDLAGNEFHIKY